ncbi:MAG: acetylxylan esterase [Betaproteobacteria bacterium]|nr:acetylxylan esterase [Betaproteobacteria bacterium]
MSRMPEVDAKRLFAYGHRMGGFVTIGLAAIAPDRLQAAALRRPDLRRPRRQQPNRLGEQWRDDVSQARDGGLEAQIQPDRSPRP